MSRIGKKPIQIPSGVSVSISSDNRVTVKGPKGELFQDVDTDITVKVEEGQVLVQRPTDQKRHKALHGLYRSLINNMVIGTHEGFKKTLELVGVGYKASVANGILELSLGFSHGIYLGIPPEVSCVAEMPKGKSPFVVLESHDKELLGQVAAKIKSLRPVEPYKGKGVRFQGEFVRRKAGKTSAKK
jgi:large subunit ribosomal protein L6